MKSLLLRRSTFVKPSARSWRALSHSSNVTRYPGRYLRPKLTKRDSSSSPTTPSTNPVDAPPPPLQNPSGTLLSEENGEADRPKRRTRTPTQKESEPIPQLPSSLKLSILWTPQYENTRRESSQSVNLPPPEFFEEILDNLQVTLHPQIQHRATYSSAAGPPVEPTLALYCPIEGGDYILDQTVHELARKTGSDVVVLDAVQLAAGESGQFGKAASALELPENPLHFSASSKGSQPSPQRSYPSDDEEEESSISRLIPSSHMTVHVLSPTTSRTARYISTTAKSPSKSKAFFDELINITPPPESGESSAAPRKPRLIYVRDYPTLAASASAWYPSLVAAVRQRRAGPIARSTSPIPNPMTIIFGATPPITPPVTNDDSSPNESLEGLISMSMYRRATATTPASVNSKMPEWGEDDSSDQARERRLQERLAKWMKSDTYPVEELPSLITSNEDNQASSGPGFARKGAAEVLVVGNQSVNLPLPALLSGLAPSLGNQRGSSAESDSGSRFYRSSVVFPSSRSIPDERACRLARRREINELMMRMATASIGGTLRPLHASELAAASPGAGEDTARSVVRSKSVKMWEDWGRTIRPWPIVCQIADRAVGFVVDQNMRSSSGIPKFTLDPTSIPWSAVSQAWVTRRSAKHIRKALLHDVLGSGSHDESEDKERKQDKEKGAETDDVIETIKRNTELDLYEQGLLGCIVDPRTLSSTFNQVHLPAKTIDSVRTIVSLPLLHPTSFRHGILKEHGITGCLLFGPPGTGKTLIVRALAKEAECRMLAIAPSDVMDMYVGEGEKIVKGVFSLARRLSPCVVFIDEIDSLFGARSSSRESGSAVAHRGIVTEFMSEMDGLRSSAHDKVIVIGATNRPFDLDDAVLRRLPLRLLVDLPGEKERKEILKILLRDEVLGPDVDLDILSKKTESFSGSDLKHLCVATALDAVKGDLSLPWTVPQVSSESDPSTTSLPDSSTEVVSQDTSLSSVTESEGPTEVSNSSPEADAEPPTEEESISGGDATLEKEWEADEDWDATEQRPKVEIKAEAESPVVSTRILTWANFTKALGEIMPSSSESLGTLGELRKWNDEFGQGRREKRRQMWGKGNFGFVDKDEKPAELKIGAEGAPRFSNNTDPKTDN